MDILISIASFILAIVILVGIHEFGHFWVARRLGVKVLRFSIGFGKPLWCWVGRKDKTEYVIAAIPLGGYVKMLDEREAAVPTDEAHRAFNRQSLKVRAAIVAAGPLFNFIFAIFAFSIAFMLGETGIRPLVGQVEPGSMAARAGITAGDEILTINQEKTPTWGLTIQALAAASVNQGVVDIQVRNADDQSARRQLDASQLGDISTIDNLLEHIGIQPQRPVIPPVFGQIIVDEAAHQAGIQTGDRVISADGETIADWVSWVEYVRARPGQTIDLIIERENQTVPLMLTPAEYERHGETIGRIGAANQATDELARYRAEYRLPPLQALDAAITRTAEYSWLTLKVLWRILTGQASVQNLSGPFTIADVAGKTASGGLVHFIKFLAIISISLGVLNLLPIPMLDGGHLFYFALEAVRGSPLPESWMENGQKIGLMLLAGLMALAFYVDFQRLFS